MPARKRALTADAFIRELEGDADHQARLTEQQRQTAELAEASAADERHLLQELHAVGVTTSSVWDFVAAGGAPPSAVPVLAAHLTQSHHPRVWEGIVRALSVKHARAALSRLSDAYRAEQLQSRRWVLANAIGSMARLAEVRELPNIDEYRALFRQSRKPAHRDPAV